MKVHGQRVVSRGAGGMGGLFLFAAALAVPGGLGAQFLASAGPAGGASVANAGGAAAADVTFARDIMPILQAKCQHCHRSGGVAPMAFESYEQVRPWAPLIKHRTGIRDRAGAMPPYYLEPGIGIQHYKNDERLTTEQVEMIATWVDAGAPLGDPADLPPARVWDDSGAWRIGEPDLVVRTQDFFMEAGAPDWWGDMESMPTGLAEDRYIRAIEIREVNDVVSRTAADGTSVGGRWIIHHMIWSTRVIAPEGADSTAAANGDGDNQGGGGATGWPVHELGRNPDIFDPRAGRLLRAGSSVVSNSVHLHSSGQDTRGHLEIGFYFHPVGYEPELRRAGVGMGDAQNIDIRGGVEGYQELHSFTVLDEHIKITTFEPHLHGPGARMCLEAIWGMQIETLACAGYDHNWVKQYAFDDDHAPILPKGTVLHIVGYMDMSEDSPNVPDPRNWQGSGNRSITNMFIDLGMRVGLTDEQFVQEMADRVERLGLGVNDHVIGCPLCMANLPPFPPEEPSADADADTDNDDRP
ncbi:MAG: hypothetical protein WEG36_03770 [Gemmatimonadota bacterium]